MVFLSLLFRLAGSTFENEAAGKAFVACNAETVMVSVAEYVNASTAKPIGKTAKNNVATDKQTHVNGTVCHRVDGKGTEANNLHTLTIQQDLDLVRQLHNYKSGLRTNASHRYLWAGNETHSDSFTRRCCNR